MIVETFQVPDDICEIMSVKITRSKSEQGITHDNCGRFPELSWIPLESFQFMKQLKLQNRQECHDSGNIAVLTLHSLVT